MQSSHFSLFRRLTGTRAVVEPLVLASPGGVVSGKVSLSVSALVPWAHSRRPFWNAHPSSWKSRLRSCPRCPPKSLQCPSAMLRTPVQGRGVSALMRSPPSTAPSMEIKKHRAWSQRRCVLISSLDQSTESCLSLSGSLLARMQSFGCRLQDAQL